MNVGTAIRTQRFVILLLACSLLVASMGVSALGEVLSPRDALSIRTGYEAAISPDGELIAYTVYVPRTPDEEPGSAYRELYVAAVESGEIRPFVTGEVSVGSPRFSPDGTRLAFLMRRGGKAKTQVWMIPADGGEAVPVTSSKTSVSTFRWHPNGDLAACVERFVAATSDRRGRLKALSVLLRKLGPPSATD